MLHGRVLGCPTVSQSAWIASVVPLVLQTCGPGKRKACNSFEVGASRPAVSLRHCFQQERSTAGEHGRSGVDAIVSPALRKLFELSVSIVSVVLMQVNCIWRNVSEGLICMLQAPPRLPMRAALMLRPVLTATVQYVTCPSSHGSYVHTTARRKRLRLRLGRQCQLIMLRPDHVQREPVEPEHEYYHTGKIAFR